MPDFENPKGGTKRETDPVPGKEEKLKAADPKLPSDDEAVLLPAPPGTAGALSKTARVLLIARLEAIEEWLPKRFPNRDIWSDLFKVLVADGRISSSLTGAAFVSDVITRVASLGSEQDKVVPNPIELSFERKAKLIHQIPELLTVVCCADGDERYSRFMLDVREAVERFEKAGSRFPSGREGLLLPGERKDLAKQLDLLADVILKGCDRRKADAKISKLRGLVTALEEFPATGKKVLIPPAFAGIETHLQSVRALIKGGNRSWDGLRTLRAFEAYLKELAEKVDERT